MAHCLNKKKTILRVKKRKFADIDAADTIVLSQPSIKKRRTITSDELNKAFNDGFNFDSNADDSKHGQNEEKSIPNFFDFEFGKQQNKKRVFKLIEKDSIKRAFQSNNFHQQSSDRRKSNILKQRRSKREDYFKNIKKEIKSQNEPQNILQHEDFSNDDEEEEPQNHRKCKSNKKIDFVKQRQIKLDHFKNKLLEKQKASRSTKIATKRQMEEHQKKLRLRNQQKNGKKSAFCDDWNHHPMDLKDNHRGIDITEMDTVNPTQFDIINIEYDDKRQKYVQNKHSVNHGDGGDDDEYDYYELVEDADPDQVIAAIEMMKERQKKKEQEREQEEVEQEEKMGDTEDGNELDLEWKLEKIKNKHLRFHKHFDKTYEGPTYGIQHQSKDSEIARFIEIEHEEFTKDDYFDYNEIQRHFENLENDQEELEKEDENYIDNDYPDEDDMSDHNEDYFYRDDDDNYYHHEDDNNDELDKYDLFDQTDHYDPNSLGLDFFNQYQFN